MLIRREEIALQRCPRDDPAVHKKRNPRVGPPSGNVILWTLVQIKVELFS